MENDEKMVIVTEVGNFSEMEIDDPTAVEVKKKKKTIEELIAESEAANIANLT